MRRPCAPPPKLAGGLTAVTTGKRSSGGSTRSLVRSPGDLVALGPGKWGPTIGTRAGWYLGLTPQIQEGGQTSRSSLIGLG